ncbi:hypothetical protein QBC44DRAFT_375178 [Cladorrhinum sp. PSN332]|nr:hypothetical protein QBC44DRAFT_375178 [Cladorrhinum sp. PSN332]
MAPLWSTNPFEALEVYDGSRSGPPLPAPEKTVAAPMALVAEAAVAVRMITTTTTTSQGMEMAESLPPNILEGKETVDPPVR